jgi:hypothetical protein
MCIQWKMLNINVRMFYTLIFFEVNCINSCILFGSWKPQFEQLIMLLWMTQKDIYILSNLFLDISIYLLWHCLIVGIQ